MLSGTPNVVTAVGDCASIVGDSGWIVPPRDPEQLAGAIAEAFEEWRNNPSAWAARRSAARTQIADNFSADRMAAGYEDAWARVLGGKAVRASKGTSSRIASAAHGSQR
jgi:glycosyltransferase involved in cell wall biosynthesis